jgi:hypothetical protein
MIDKVKNQYKMSSVEFKSAISAYNLVDHPLIQN